MGLLKTTGFEPLYEINEIVRFQHNSTRFSPCMGLGPVCASNLRGIALKVRRNAIVSGWCARPICHAIRASEVSRSLVR
jgi:hypothetical protein